MRDHERHGIAMRDGIARGDLEQARREAKVLADLRIEDALDATWRRRLDAMNAAAARVATATTLAEASRGLGAVAQTCGDCHTTLGGPKPTVGEPPGGSGVTPHMQRHQWAAANLWNGMVLGSDDAWKAGASVLADAPLEPELLTPEKSPVPKVKTLADAVHGFAQKAMTAKTPTERGAVYGEVMATCSTCHSWLGGGPR